MKLILIDDAYVNPEHVAALERGSRCLSEYELKTMAGDLVAVRGEPVPDEASTVMRLSSGTFLYFARSRHEIARILISDQVDDRWPR